MIRTLQSWLPNDQGVYTTPIQDYNVDASNVVLGKSYYPNGPGLPGRSMNPAIYPNPQYGVSVSVNINADVTYNPGQLLIGVYVQDTVVIPSIFIPPPHNKANHPSITAHLEHIGTEHLLVIDVVYENDEDSPGDPDIYHMRFIQGQEGAWWDFSPVYSEPVQVNPEGHHHCHHPDVVYDAVSYANELGIQQTGHLLVVYDGIDFGSQGIFFAEMNEPGTVDDPDFYTPGTWSSYRVSKTGAIAPIYPRFDVGNTKIRSSIGQPWGPVWTIWVSWMQKRPDPPNAYGIWWTFDRNDLFSQASVSGWLPVAPGQSADHNCYIPFVEIAPREYYFSDERAAVILTYTQMENGGDAGAYYFRLENITEDTGFFDSQHVPVWEGPMFDQGLVQAALDATGMNYDGKCTFLYGPTLPPGSTLQVWSADIAWKFWDYDISGQIPIPGGNQVEPQPYYSDKFTPSISICLPDTYRAVWTDRRNSSTAQDVYTNYWTP